jgi:hypothetical protein
MRTELSTVTLTPMEAELLLASLAHYERKFRDDRPEHLAEFIRVLRGKLLDVD